MAPRKGRTKGDRTRALNKDLALLVYLGELTLEKIFAKTSISKSSISHHLRNYEEVNQRPMLELLRDDVLQRTKAKLPALFPPAAAGPHPALPAVEIQWDGIPLDAPASKVKRAAQVAACAYYNQHKELPGMSWKAACTRTKQAFDRRKFKHPLKALNADHTSRGNKHNTLASDKPRPGNQPALHSEFEGMLAWIIRFMRSTNAPMNKAIICHLVNSALEKAEEQGIPSPLPGGPTAKWFKGFCDRHDLVSFNEEPLDLTRHSWCTAKNFFESYLAFGGRMVEAGIMTRNEKFVSVEVTPTEPPFFWIESERWRCMESDEMGMDLGIKTDEKPKTKQERMVGPRGGNRQVTRQGSCEHHISGLFSMSHDGQTMLPGMCVDAGEGACLAEHVLKDDDGTDFTVPLPDGNGGLEEVEVFWWSNDKGSWDSTAIIAYMKAAVERHQRVNHKVFTKEKPGVWFVDGCQVHLCDEVLAALLELHVWVHLKLPYGSTKMNTMDAQGTSRACRRQISSCTAIGCHLRTRTLHHSPSAPRCHLRAKHSRVQGGISAASSRCSAMACVSAARRWRCCSTSKRRKRAGKSMPRAAGSSCVISCRS